MSMPVVTVSSGGLPVVDITATTPKFGVPVTEAANGRGQAVTKVTAGGLAVTYAAEPGSFTPAALDPTSAQGVSLSGSNLVASNTLATGSNGVRIATTSGRTTGKYYYEVAFTTIVGSSSCLAAIASTAAVYSQLMSSGTGGSGTVLFQNGQVNAAGANQANIPALTSGDAAGVAVDLDNRRVWFRKLPAGDWNGVPANNPSTNTGGATITTSVGQPMSPAVVMGAAGGSIGNVMTSNFGASAFSGAVPAGFTSGWPT